MRTVALSPGSLVYQKEAGPRGIPGGESVHFIDTQVCQGRHSACHVAGVTGESTPAVGCRGRTTAQGSAEQCGGGGIDHVLNGALARRTLRDVDSSHVSKMTTKYGGNCRIYARAKMKVLITTNQWKHAQSDNPTSIGTSQLRRLMAIASLDLATSLTF